MTDGHSKLLREIRKKKMETKKMENCIDVKWTKGKYYITIPLVEYEIVIEAPSIKETKETPTVSVFFNGIEVTSFYVDATVGRRIFASGINLARLMALVLKKEKEEA